VASLNVRALCEYNLGPRPNDTPLVLTSRRTRRRSRSPITWRSNRVQAKRLQKVIELNYAAGPRPMEDREHDFTYYVKLSTVVADDGKSFELKDEAGPRFVTRDSRMFTIEVREHPYPGAVIVQLVEQNLCVSRKYSVLGQNNIK